MLFNIIKEVVLFVTYFILTNFIYFILIMYIFKECAIYTYYILYIIYYIFIIIELTLSLIPPTFSINY
jgi:hypothetical protein